MDVLFGTPAHAVGGPAGYHAPDDRADSPQLTLVLPAYNEAERIGPALDELFGYLGAAVLRARRPLGPGAGAWDVLVVDDGSTDATAAMWRRGRRRPGAGRQRAALRVLRLPTVARARRCAAGCSRRPATSWSSPTPTWPRRRPDPAAHGGARRTTTSRWAAGSSPTAATGEPASRSTGGCWARSSTRSPAPGSRAPCPTRSAASRASAARRPRPVRAPAITSIVFDAESSTSRDGVATHRHRARPMDGQARLAHARPPGARARSCGTSCASRSSIGTSAPGEHPPRSPAQAGTCRQRRSVGGSQASGRPARWRLRGDRRERRPGKGARRSILVSRRARAAASGLAPRSAPTRAPDDAIHWSVPDDPAGDGRDPAARQAYPMPSGVPQPQDRQRSLDVLRAPLPSR